MRSTWIRKVLAVCTLAVIGFAVGCFNDPAGSYRDAEEPHGGTVLELKDGKATINFGQMRIDAKYTVDGDKVTIKPEGGPAEPLVLIIQSDGSLKAERANPLFQRLVKK